MHDHVIRLCICTCMYSNFEQNDMTHFRQEMMRQQLLYVIHRELPVHVKVAKKVYMEMGYKCTCTCTFMYYMMYKCTYIHIYCIEHTDLHLHTHVHLPF